MGIKIISEDMPTQRQLLSVMREAEFNQRMYPDLGIFPSSENNGKPEYYVCLVDTNPYQYLIFTLDEVMHLMKTRRNYNGSRTALRNLLRTAEVPLAEENDDDLEREKEQEDGEIEKREGGTKEEKVERKDEESENNEEEQNSEEEGDKNEEEEADEEEVVEKEGEVAGAGAKYLPYILLKIFNFFNKFSERMYFC